MIVHLNSWFFKPIISLRGELPEQGALLGNPPNFYFSVNQYWISCGSWLQRRHVGSGSFKRLMKARSPSYFPVRSFASRVSHASCQAIDEETERWFLDIWPNVIPDGRDFSEFGIRWPAVQFDYRNKFICILGRENEFFWSNLWFHAKINCKYIAQAYCTIS